MLCCCALWIVTSTRLLGLTRRGEQTVSVSWWRRPKHVVANWRHGESGQGKCTRWNFWTRFGRETAFRRIKSGDVEENPTFRVVDLPFWEIISAASPPFASSVCPRSSHSPNPDATTQHSRHIAHTQPPTHYIDVNKSRLVFIQSNPNTPHHGRLRTPLACPVLGYSLHSTNSQHYTTTTPPHPTPTNFITMVRRASQPPSYSVLPLTPRRRRRPSEPR